MTKNKYCFICKKVTTFINTSSPSGYWLCLNCCFYRTSFGRYKFIEDRFGYRFEEGMEKEETRIWKKPDLVSYSDIIEESKNEIQSSNRGGNIEL